MNLLVKNIVRFATGSTIGGVFNFVSFFVVAKIVGPEKWGVWMIFNIILKFSPMIQFGSIESVQRNLPILLGQNKLNQVSSLQNNTFTITILSGILLAVLLFLIGPLFEIDKVLLWIFIPIVFFNLMSYFYGVIFRSYNQFNVVGIVSFLNGFFSLISIVLAYSLSFEGFLFGQLIRFFLVLLFNKWYCKSTFKLDFNLLTYRKLIFDGFPILMIVISNYFVTLSDRIIIATMFDKKQLGIYGLAYLVINPFIIISGSINSVFYTSASEKFGREGKYLKFQKINNLTNLLIIYFGLSIGIIVIVLPFIVNTFLDSYSSGIAAAKILLIAHVFFFSSGILTNVYFTLGFQKARLYLILFSLLINIFFSIIFLLLFERIESVAIGSLISFFTLYVLLYLNMRKVVKVESRVFIDRLIHNFLLITWITTSSYLISFLEIFNSLILNALINTILLLLIQGVIIIHIFKIKSFKFGNI